ncbi:MAG: sensor domain-containing diguanylate cyclase [candidate division WOR-3 bacterium]
MRDFNLILSILLLFIVSAILNLAVSFEINNFAQIFLGLIFIFFLLFYFIRFFFYPNHLFFLLPLTFLVPFLNENFGWFLYFILLSLSTVLGILDYERKKVNFYFFLFTFFLWIRTYFHNNDKILYTSVITATTFITLLLAGKEKSKKRNLEEKYENLSSKNKIIEISPFMLEKEQILNDDLEKNKMILSTIDDAIVSLLSTLKILLNNKSVVFFLLNKKNGYLFIEYGLSNEDINLKTTVFNKENFLYSVVNDLKNIKDNFFTGDISKLSLYKNNTTVRSIVSLPVIKSGECVGVLYVDDTEEEKFKDKDMQTIKLFSDQIGMILNFAEYAQQAKTEATVISILNEITHKLSKTLDFEEIIKIITGSLRIIIDFSNYFLVSFEKSNLKILMTDSNIKKYPQTISENSFLHLAFNQDNVFYKTDLLDRDIPIYLFQKGDNVGLFNSAISIPVFLDEEKRIFLILISGENLSIDSGKNFLLNFISDITITASEKSFLYQKTKDLAIKDGLTGIYNHRFFQDELTKILLNSQRTDKKVSLGLLDIDYFKKFNDTYGHQIGDLVLKHIANILQQSLRKTDLVARYGGEEFVIVLTNIKDDSFENVFENIRKKIEDTKIKISSNEELSVTVSIGFSLFPDDTKDKNLLINFADTALYKAKELGRNRVVRYQK